jgi:hypothetical protein
MHLHAHMNRLKKIIVADPTHFDADPDLDPTFHLETDPDLTFHFDADPYLDPDPAPRQNDANLQIFNH